MPHAPILLDLDGTLIDATGDLLDAVNALRGGLGAAPVDAAVIHSLTGPGRRVMVEAVTRGLDIDLDEAIEVFAGHLRRTEPSGTRILPGVPELLAALADHPLAVVTNKPQENAVRVVDGLGLRPPIQVVVGPDGSQPNKPDPAMLVQALELLGVAPSGGWMVGDAVSDLVAGRAAGLRVAAVTWGIGTADELAGADPDVLVHHPSELARALLGPARAGQPRSR